MPPRTTSKSDQVVVCLTAFAFQPSAGPALLGTAGRRYRVSDPIVQANPARFAPDGLSEAEYERRRTAIAERKADANALAHAAVVGRATQQAADERVEPRDFRPYERPISVAIEASTES